MPTAISPSELARALQGNMSPQLIDVRRKPAFDASERMIAHACWRNPEQLSGWMPDLDKSRDVVVYCVHGHAVSQTCAAQLAHAGFRASYLEGGFEHWALDNLPVVEKHSA